MLVDRRPHLTAHGVQYFAHLAKTLTLITDNARHPAFALTGALDNLHVLYHPAGVDLRAAMQQLRARGVRRLTLQAGGTLSGAFLRAGLIGLVDLVIAPVLVGGADTPTAVDGGWLTRVEQLYALQPLQRLSCEALSDSYVRLRYRAHRPTAAYPHGVGSRTGPIPSCAARGPVPR